MLKKTPKEPVDILPHIELNLPKRPIRERLGVRGTTKESAENKEKDKNKAKLPTSPERLLLITNSFKVVRENMQLLLVFVC